MYEDLKEAYDEFLQDKDKFFEKFEIDKIPNEDIPRWLFVLLIKFMVAIENRIALMEKNLNDINDRIP